MHEKHTVGKNKQLVKPVKLNVYKKQNKAQIAEFKVQISLKMD